MATNINALKQEIMNRISSEVSTVQDVSNYGKVIFSGFPAVTVRATGNNNEFWSVGENQRAFNFDIDVYQQIAKNVGTADNNAREKAERIMSNVVSDIIDAFDDYVEFGGAADFLRAAPSDLDEVEGPEGYYLHAKIKLQIVSLYTTS